MGGYGSRIPRENLGISHIPQNFLDLSRIPQHAHSLLFLYCIFLRLFIFSLRNNTSKMPYSSIVERVSKIYDRLPFKYITCELKLPGLSKHVHQFLIIWYSYVFWQSTHLTFKNIPQIAVCVSRLSLSQFERETLISATYFFTFKQL